MCSHSCLQSSHDVMHHLTQPPRTTAATPAVHVATARTSPIMCAATRGGRSGGRGRGRGGRTTVEVGSSGRSNVTTSTGSARGGGGGSGGRVVAAAAAHPHSPSTPTSANKIGRGTSVGTSTKRGAGAGTHRAASGHTLSASGGGGTLKPTRVARANPATGGQLTKTRERGKHNASKRGQTTGADVPSVCPPVKAASVPKDDDMARRLVGRTPAQGSTLLTARVTDHL
jgi:hypothetical protein